MKKSFDKRYSKLFLDEQWTGAVNQNPNRYGQITIEVCGSTDPNYPVGMTANIGGMTPSTAGYFICHDSSNPPNWDRRMCDSGDLGQGIHSEGISSVAVFYNIISAPDSYNVHWKLTGLDNPFYITPSPPNGGPYSTIFVDPCMPSPALNCPCPSVPGCTDPLAINYNFSATFDDGSCIYPISGCTDLSACNYDPNANVDDGSCFYPDGCTDSTACNYDPNALCDDGSCTGLFGCTNPDAINYNANAGPCDDGSCYGCTLGGYSNSCTTCPNDCNGDPVGTNNSGWDGCCTAIPIYGCTDPTACNYDPNANTNDPNNPCIFPDGCTDAAACNYDPNAQCDDGSCDYTSCLGCTDSSVQGNIIVACSGTCSQYDPNATQDDGSCCVIGCTDQMANNYDPAACIDDGSCTYTPLVPGCPDPTVVGQIVNTTTQFCVNGCEIYDSAADGCEDTTGNVIMGDTSCCCSFGCTDPLAINHDPWACIDDGSCQIPIMVCSCCESNGPGNLSSPVGFQIPQLTPGGCASLNSATLTNCNTPQAFNPSDCDPDCTTFDFAQASSQSTSLGSSYNTIMDAYNMGLQFNQVHGILDGNSPFCVEYCDIGNGNHWACDCCGDIHDCDNDSFWPKPYGCWTCKGAGMNMCGQPSTTWMNNNQSTNYYNNQTDCLAAAPNDCPQIPDCTNTPAYCSTNPDVDECWICHHGTFCMMVYDYLQYGSGPPGSVGTQAFMMNWLTYNSAAGTYTTPQGSELFCDVQTCLANSQCTEIGNYLAPDCEPPAAGCPTGEVWLPYPKCECQLPKTVLPVDKKIEKEKDNEIEKEDDKMIKEEMKRMNNLWNYKK